MLRVIVAGRKDGSQLSKMARSRSSCPKPISKILISLNFRFFISYVGEVKKEEVTAKLLYNTFLFEM
jgi:hypothetical protein